MPSSFSKTFIKNKNMRHKDTDGLRALTHRDFSTKLKFHELRAFAILMAMTEPTAPKVDDVGPNMLVLTTKKDAQALLIRYVAESGQATVEFVYDHQAHGLFLKIRRCFGSSLSEPLTSSAEVVEFTTSTSQDCA
jgi:hypothetical protein